MNLKQILIPLLAFPMIAIADVNLENGNFYITYTDVLLRNNDHELNISRNYNSLASELGWFGYGWGSKYETKLVALPDGSVAIHEAGNGIINYYRTNNEDAIKKGIQRIVQAAIEHDKLTPDAAEKLEVQLLGNEDLRLKKVISYGIHVELPNDTSLDDLCGKASLVRVSEGYRRNDCNRFGDNEVATDTFDLQGRLIRHQLADGYAVTIHYDDTGVNEIRDTLGQSISLTWTDEGQVASAKTNSEEVKYTYDEKQDLIEFATKSGNNYRYSYDYKHNLTRITYIDDSSTFISYSPKMNGIADALTERNGDQQTFVYSTHPSNPNHHWTKHTVISHSGQSISKEYEYENQTSDTGATHLARIVKTGSGNSIETIFDKQGRVTRKLDASGEVIKYAYHPRNGKVNFVSTNKLKTEYIYDKRGNLIRVKNSNGQVLKLYYHSAQIQRIVDINLIDKIRRELKFKYNLENRPVEVTLIGTGKITVEYDDKGDISTVNSSNGSKVAELITKVFQDFLNLVAVAGVHF